MSRNEKKIGSQEPDVWTKAEVTHEEIYTIVKHPLPTQIVRISAF